MNKWKSIGVLVFSLAILVACIDENEHKKTTTIEQVEMEKEGVSFSITELPHELHSDEDTAQYSIKVDFKLEKGAEDYTQNGITKIVFSYPLIDSFSQMAIKDSINAIINTVQLQDVTGAVRYVELAERMTEFLEEYEEHNSEMEEFGLPSSNWVFEMTINVILNTHRLMALQVHQLEFTGGAHANSLTNYLNLNLETGKILTLDDLFTENYQTALLEISEKAFKQATNLAVDTNLVETHYEFNDGDFVLPPNFSIGKEGIHFYYNPYDLGPYALGAISFQIPYQEILSIIDSSVLDLRPTQ